MTHYLTNWRRLPQTSGAVVALSYLMAVAVMPAEANRPEDRSATANRDRVAASGTPPTLGSNIANDGTTAGATGTKTPSKTGIGAQTRPAENTNTPANAAKPSATTPAAPPESAAKSSARRKAVTKPQPDAKLTAKAKRIKALKITDKSGMTMKRFLDRLMLAESDGNDRAANPRSSARGAFQFINSTFLVVARRYFPKEVANLTNAQILALRYDRKFARLSAEAYTRENAAYLVSRGIKPTFVHLRLAFLLGPYGAERVLKSKAEMPLARVLQPAVLKANPFMTRLTVAGLRARAARDLRVRPNSTAGVKVKIGGKYVVLAPPKPRIKVRCNLARPSCRRWLALQRRKLAIQDARKKRRSKKGKVQRQARR